MIPEILVTVNSTESKYRSYPALEYHLAVLENMTTLRFCFITKTFMEPTKWKSEI